MNSRHPITFAVLMSMLLLPYWIYLPILAAAAIFLPLFWEGILLALLADALYGSPFFTSFPIALLTLFLLMVSVPLRERLRTYA